MKLLTSLGTGKYEEVEYIWGERHCKTRWFPQAVAKWLQPEDIVVFLTEKSAQHENWQQFKDHVGGQEVRIPEGRNELELWEIFDIVTQQVNDNESVVIDITHAFRSLPIVFFIVTAFLRAVKAVDVKHILYGCFVQQQSTAQVIDLKWMLELLDWMEGAKRLKELGDATLIGEILVDTQDQLHRQQIDKAPKTLKSAGQKIQELTKQLKTARVLEAMQTADSLLDKLQKTHEETTKWAKPFRLLLDETQNQVKKIAYDQPDDLNQTTLKKQLAMVRQMWDYGLVVQAAELAREWMVNWAIGKYVQQVGAEASDWLGKETRSEVETQISLLTIEASSPDLLQRELPPLADLLDGDTRQRFREIWNEIAEVRNDMAHCGMRRGAKPAEALLKRLENLIDQLEKFWEAHQ